MKKVMGKNLVYLFSGALCAVIGKWGYAYAHMDLFPTEALDQIKVKVVSGVGLNPELWQ